MRNDKQLIEDILEALDNIERHAQKGKLEFDRNELVRIWFIHHIQVIGEIAARLSEALKIAHREIPWRRITGIRNNLAHQYFGIDLEEVWATATKIMPEFFYEILAKYRFITI